MTWIDDATATTEHAIETMKHYRFDVLPVMAGSRVIGYFQTDRWGDFSSVKRKPLVYRDVIPLDTHVRDLIKDFAVESRLFYFLSSESNIAGLVTVANLNSRQVKVYLFSLLSELEIRLGEFVTASVPERDLMQITFAGNNAEKYESVRRRYKADQENGVELRLVEYLYLSDFINIVTKKALFSSLGYTKKEFKDYFGSVNNLRDTVAHPSRSIITSLSTVESLWQRIDRIEDALFRLRMSQSVGA